MGVLRFMRRRATGLVLEGRRSPVAYKNIVTNPDFKNGLQGWSAPSSSGAISLVGGMLLLTATGVQLYSSCSGTVPWPVIGNLYYVKMRFRVTNPSCLSVRLQANSITATILSDPSQNTWYERGAIVTANSGGNSILSFHYYADAATANGKVMEIQYVSCIDLTARFGAGAEPSKAWCDLNLPFVNSDNGLAIPALAMPEKMADRSRYLNHGTLTGATWKQLPSGAWVLDFTSAANKVEIPANASINDMPLFTFDDWVYVNGAGGANQGRLLDKGTKYLMYDSANARFEFGQTFSTTAGAWNTPTNGVLTAGWYHVQISYDRQLTTNDPVICINGISKTIMESSTPVGTASTDAASALVLGNRTAADRYLNGYLSPPRIYDYIRTEAQALATFNAERWIYGL